MMRAGAAFSGALAAKCSRQKLCGSFAMPGNATGYGLRTADYGLRTTDDGDGKMANSKCSANFNWLGPFVYPFVLIYLHVICFDRHLCRPLSLARSLVRSSRTLSPARTFSSACFSCFPAFPLPFMMVLLGSRLSAWMPVTYGCYVHYQYALYGSPCRFIFCQRFSSTFYLDNTKSS